MILVVKNCSMNRVKSVHIRLDETVYLLSEEWDVGNTNRPRRTGHDKTSVLGMVWRVLVWGVEDGKPVPPRRSLSRASCSASSGRCPKGQHKTLCFFPVCSPQPGSRPTPAGLFSALLPAPTKKIFSRASKRAPRRSAKLQSAHSARNSCDSSLHHEVLSPCIVVG